VCGSEELAEELESGGCFGMRRPRTVAVFTKPSYPTVPTPGQ
jgi:hypothetical protein